ncbi:hypothetical protein F7725_015035 [Dissostichus mawsoni]|uniref:Uncharacterized protein n=1 Tax=Dissostichus mawsoni TaxID=36200 RepID=A0A7J5YJR9_DISMA|nr:hypothetical protein F7725_015035 [Dissostichus mawsoni]
MALCGGSVKNASVGRVLSPSPHHGPNAPQDRSCSWALEAPKDQRLVLWSGLDAGSVVLFDSGRGGQIPFEGVISEGPANGNFTTSDLLYGVGAVIQFTCDQGHALEQGPPVIECISARDPTGTTPSRCAKCGGDLAGPGGVILSPNWPEWYGEGEDCSWRIHVGEDKRVLLDVMTRILGRYVGGSTPFKLFSSTPDLTITFHSDPAGLPLIKLSVTVFPAEVSRNDSCPDLPEIQNGWKTTSHIALVRGARITYQCDPGYDLVGRETLACQLDLSWSNQPPFCEKSQFLSYLSICCVYGKPCRWCLCCSPSASFQEMMETKMLWKLLFIIGNKGFDRIMGKFKM